MHLYLRYSLISASFTVRMVAEWYQSVVSALKAYTLKSATDKVYIKYTFREQLFFDPCPLRKPLFCRSPIIVSIKDFPDGLNTCIALQC